MGFGEPGERQDLICGLIKVIGSISESSFGEVADDTVVLGPHLIRVGLGEYGAHHGGDRRQAEYRRRMELSYPIHPELFDRLFGDWSALDKFQRTRGVLRLMALAISELWQRGDQSLMIMPGNLPMDSAALVSEMKKYLDDGWDPIIKSDVDGENSLPLRIDRDNKYFGRISATRRTARDCIYGFRGTSGWFTRSRHQVDRAWLRATWRAVCPVFGRAQASLRSGDPSICRRVPVLVLAPAERHSNGRGPGGIQLHRS